MNPLNRPVYPYRMGEKHQKAGKQASYTKKGPGRRHRQGCKA